MRYRRRRWPGKCPSRAALTRGDEQTGSGFTGGQEAEATKQLKPAGGACERRAAAKDPWEERWRLCRRAQGRAERGGFPVPTLLPPGVLLSEDQRSTLENLQTPGGPVPPAPWRGPGPCWGMEDRAGENRRDRTTPPHRTEVIYFCGTEDLTYFLF